MIQNYINHYKTINDHLKVIETHFKTIEKQYNMIKTIIKRQKPLENDERLL